MAVDRQNIEVRGKLAMRYLRPTPSPRACWSGCWLGLWFWFPRGHCQRGDCRQGFGPAIVRGRRLGGRELHDAAFACHPRRHPAPRSRRRTGEGEPEHGDPPGEPDEGVAGAPLTISGSHLAANADVELTWSTADATWLVQAKPDTVNYLGRSDTLFAVVLAKTTTNSNGSFQVSLTVPLDWGGLHDIYAVVNGVQVAHGGFITLRTVTVTPTSGPIGTPITITYSGLGATCTRVGRHCSGTTTTWAR